MMGSPFPGMDPYLESQGLWPDFHSNFMNCWREALLDQLPEAYDARLDERLYLLEQDGVQGRVIRPDVVISRNGGAVPSTVGRSAAATLEPVTVPLCLVDEVREVSIRILHRRDQTLVAVLELLSPSNKSIAGQGGYLEKRLAVLSQLIHLVELDLLIGGHRLPMGCPLPAGHYYTLVSRSEHRPDCDVYAWTVRDPLPAVPIPLKSPDPDVVVHLDQVFDTAYQRGRYERAIDYAAAPSAVLDTDDSQWAASRASVRATRM